MKTILIGISGHAGSGKDTVAAYIKDYLELLTDEKYSVNIEGFAAPLKEAAMFLFGFGRKELEDRYLKEQPLPVWGVSPRAILQFVGTELFRVAIKELIPNMAESFWVQRKYTKLEQIKAQNPRAVAESAHVEIVPDVRFQDEADWVVGKQGGYLIRVRRPGADGAVGIAGHASEGELNVHGYPANRVYELDNSGTLEDLKLKSFSYVEAILRVERVVAKRQK